MIIYSKEILLGIFIIGLSCCNISWLQLKLDVLHRYICGIHLWLFGFLSFFSELFSPWQNIVIINLQESAYCLEFYGISTTGTSKLPSQVTSNYIIAITSRIIWVPSVTVELLLWPPSICFFFLISITIWATLNYSFYYCGNFILLWSSNGLLVWLQVYLSQAISSHMRIFKYYCEILVYCGISLFIVFQDSLLWNPCLLYIF